LENIANETITNSIDLPLMIEQLTEKEYLATMKSGMTDITESDKAVVDIWPYAQLLSNEGLINRYVVDNTLVEKVYESKDGSYHHVLLPTSNSNRFVVIVVLTDLKQIKGYYQLNLDELYHL
jgi:hypothetical protein